MAENEIKRVITIESSESLNTLNHLNARIKELRGSMGDLDITTEEYRQVSEEVARLENVRGNAMRGNTAALEGSYNAYSKELSILQKHRKTLQENSDEYKEMTTRVAELQEKLKAMDAEVGMFQRNVGNYESAFDGLQGSVNSVVAQLPNLKNGFIGFAESLKEALPNLIKSVKNYQDMADKAGQSGNALKALGKAVISWNAAISIAVMLIAMFGEKIWEWAKGLFDAEKRLTNAQRAVKEFNEEVKEGGLGIGEQITQLKKMQSAWNDLGNDMSAKHKYIEENRKAFEDLGIEINNVADAERFFIDQVDDYVKAMKQRALAAAAYKKAAEYYDKAATLEALNMVDRDKYEAMPDMLHMASSNISPMGAGFITQDYKNPVKTALGEQMAERDKEIAQYYEMGNALFDLAAAYDVATEAEQRANGGSGSSSGKASPKKGPAPFTSSVNSVGTGVATYDVLDSATDAAAENEKLKATLKAKAQMLGASAEEQKAIEQKLADDIALIEETRLGLQEVALNEMLRNEELSAEERLAIEEQLTQTKIALIELQLKAEEERAAEQKDIRDREVEEEKARHEAVLQAQSQLQSATSNILKTAAGFAKENSKAQKALNAAAIVYDTYTAAMSGWKTAQVLPAPFNAVVGAANVAASVAMGALQLRNLMRTAEDGSNAMSAMSAAQSAPSVASSMPASYTRNLQGDNELTEMNKSTRVFVVENDITEAQNRAKARVQSASF